MMSGLSSHFPILIVLLPLFGALLCALTRKGTLAWAIATCVVFAMPVVAVTMLVEVFLSGEAITYRMGDWEAPFGIVYKVDLLSAMFMTLISVLAAVNMPFARRSVAFEIHSHLQSWYYTMYLLCLCGLIGITVTGDAFNAFVFLEISSLATYVLIALGKHRRALLASYQYLIMGTIGATFYVVGVGLLYVVTGTLNFDDIALRLGTVVADGNAGQYFAPVMAALAFVVVGVCLKLALFPLHVWLPNAYTYAPSHTSAFLAGTATKAAVYLLVRLLFSVFGKSGPFAEMPVGTVLVVLGLAAMFIAAVTAVFETNAKRMLAYSSVSQMGYITLGIGIANISGLTGALAHIINHGVMKTALFLALGAVAYRIGSTRISDMSGLGRKMPLTMAAFMVAGLGLIGTPGTAGFISKWYLVLGALEKGWWPVVFAIVLSSLVSVIYMGRITEVLWFREPSGEALKAKDPPLSMLVPIWVLALATVYLGFDTRASVGIAAPVAEALFGGVK